MCVSKIIYTQDSLVADPRSFRKEVTCEPRNDLDSSPLFSLSDSVVENRRAESEDLRFESSWGLLCPTLALDIKQLSLLVTWLKIYYLSYSISYIFYSNVFYHSQCVSFSSSTRSLRYHL